MRAQLEALKATQARTAAEISALAARLERVEGLASAPIGTPALAGERSRATSAAASGAPGAATTRLSIAGDVRLRYEANQGPGEARDRDRGVLRARLRATYAVNDWLTAGGQLATGDPDDPNSTDITLTGFDDDLQVSLDQAWLRGRVGPVEVTGGKVPLPFVRTDLVWDGDVSPQGVAAAASTAIGPVRLRASGLYFLVDEAPAGPDSRMIGGQLSSDFSWTARWRAGLAIGYYDYALRSLDGADAGDFRGNLRRADGSYLSDFNLLNAIGFVEYNGLGPRWPARLSIDAVRNLGAASGQNDGIAIDAFIGSVTDAGSVRVNYGFATAETDAVLAAFSQDNTPLATNYLLHQLGLDYALRRNIILNATLYRQRALDLVNPGWLTRLRLNMLVQF